MKIFSDSFLNSFNILKKAKIGFEVEAYSKLNYPTTLEVFNRKLDGVKVHGFKQYHSDYKPDENNFKLEPDMSGGMNMFELVTGPLEYNNARLYIIKICKILQEIAYTQDRSSLHINISFSDKEKSIDKINPLKLILNLEETKIYNYFPEREDNIYAKSIKNIIPFKDYDYSGASVNVLNNSLLLPNTKYYGVNFGTLDKGRLEFRYIGGENYEYKVDQILDLLDYFIITSYESLNSNLSEKEVKMLRQYLDENIRKYKSLNKINNFLSLFPTIELQVDQKSDYELISTYYSQFYNKIFTLTSFIKNLKDCIINYDSLNKKIEVVSAENIKVVGVIENVDFVSCEIKSGDFSTCNFYNCEIEDSILNGSHIKNSNVKDSKLLECNVNSTSKIENCFFTEGFLNGYMIGGVFRSGKIGEEGTISTETKIFTEDSNFFNIDMQTLVNSDDKKKGVYFKKKFK